MGTAHLCITGTGEGFADRHRQIKNWQRRLLHNDGIMGIISSCSAACCTITG
ncbi:MAG: hypothetical protein GDA56_11890 [Hormoscilla sp. GM7CHS1pb]|nr:hypothetical protein [Hormoscilla sp. GM7CHS1pb]